MPSVGSSCGRDLDEVEAAEGGGACAGVAIAAVDVSTVDFTALGPGKFETIENELGAGKSGCQVRARVAGLTYPRCVAPLEAVFAAVWWETHRDGTPPHPRTVTEKANGSF